MERYESLGTVGEGSYGVVLKCKDKKNGLVVAIKKFLEYDTEKSVKKIAAREIKILKTLKHENLVNLIEVFRKSKRIFLVFEYIQQNLLEEIEKTKTGLGEFRTREVMFQVVRGIDFMHSNNYIHRDLKPENILINNNGLVKLCDFGFARQIAQQPEAYTDYVATRWYRAPELLVGDVKYGKPVDVWSIGVLAYEVLTARPLYPGESDLDQLYLIMNSLGDIPDSMKTCFSQNQFYLNCKLPKIKNYQPLQNKLKRYSPYLGKFISDCLHVDPTKRAVSPELLKHEYFLSNGWVDEFLVKLKSIVALHEATIPSLGSNSVMSSHSSESNKKPGSQSTSKPSTNSQGANDHAPISEPVIANSNNSTMDNSLILKNQGLSTNINAHESVEVAAEVVEPNSSSTPTKGHPGPSQGQLALSITLSTENLRSTQVDKDAQHLNNSRSETIQSKSSGANNTLLQDPLSPASNPISSNHVAMPPIHSKHHTNGNHDMSFNKMKGHLPNGVSTNENLNSHSLNNKFNGHMNSSLFFNNHFNGYNKSNLSIFHSESKGSFGSNFTDQNKKSNRLISDSFQLNRPQAFRELTSDSKNSKVFPKIDNKYNERANNESPKADLQQASLIFNSTTSNNSLMNYKVDSNFINNYTNSNASTLNGISVPSKPAQVNFINKNKIQASSFVRRIGVNNVDYFSSMTNKQHANGVVGNVSNGTTNGSNHHDSNEFIVTRPLNYKAGINNANTHSNLNNSYTNSQTNIYKNPLSFFNNNNNSSSNGLNSNSFNNNMTSSTNSLMPSSSNNLNLNQLSGINPTNYYYFDQNFKLNKKNASHLRNGNGMSTNENKLKNGDSSITLPQVKQIELFSKPNKPIIFEKKSFLMQVNKK